MRITGRELRRVINEEVRRSLFLEQDAVATPDTDTTDTPKETPYRKTPDESDAIMGIRKAIRKINASSSMIDLLAEILRGKKILSSNTPDSVDGNLLVNGILNLYALENLDDPVIYAELYGAMGTAYPEKLVKAVQRKLGIQVDGDFGRQTLVSVLTNGRVKMVPAHMRKQNNPNMFKLLSKSIMLALIAITPVGMGFEKVINDAMQVGPT